jgi:hypothetical protein
MVKDMKASLLMISVKVKESSTGKMEESTMECGKMANSMERAHSLLRMVHKELENGIKAGRLSGFPD